MQRPGEHEGGFQVETHPARASVARSPGGGTQTREQGELGELGAEFTALGNRSTRLNTLVVICGFGWRSKHSLESKRNEAISKRTNRYSISASSDLGDGYASSIRNRPLCGSVSGHCL